MSHVACVLVPEPVPWHLRLLQPKERSKVVSDRHGIANHVGKVLVQLRFVHSIPPPTDCDHPSLTYRIGTLPGIELRAKQRLVVRVFGLHVSLDLVKVAIGLVSIQIAVDAQNVWHVLDDVEDWLEVLNRVVCLLELLAVFVVQACSLPFWAPRRAVETTHVEVDADFWKRNPITKSVTMKGALCKVPVIDVAREVLRLEVFFRVGLR